MSQRENFDFTIIPVLVRNGLSFICANCENFWWSYEKKLDKCRVHYIGDRCGGPLVGMAFPKYKGPLIAAMSSFCFVCGNAAELSVSIGKVKCLGVCKKHSEMIDKKDDWKKKKAAASLRMVK